ncbi:MAG: TonB-dependent receptor [Flavobacteriales bacterium 32-35-8]|nr:MAG: TonB-dependent receptor [Flavobacteriales bacterium 32-35-8]
MKKILIIVVIMLTTHAFSQSQSFKISGKLLTDGGNNPLESATVYLERVKDSSMVTYTITDRNGYFYLESKTGDSELNFFISFVGYETYFKTIKLEGSEINLGTINLKIDTNALDEVIVKSTAPVVIKQDTLEFNSDSFKTKKDANIEDLLRELPGVEVDENGSIKINGKSVDKILVDGKPFFGTDPTITTRNLNKDIISKIQVSDTKTDAEAFAGETGSQTSKTINLVMKEDKNKGVFGRVAGGVGTDDRYEYAGMFNLFKGDQRLSILAGGNNINQSGFSYGEISKMLGGANSIISYGNGTVVIDGRNFGGGQGITNSRSSGANYADDLGKKLDISANYFNSKSDSENESITERENIFTDRTFFNDSQSKTINETDSHDLGMQVRIKPDSLLFISVNPKLTHVNSESIGDTNGQSYNASRVLTNESTTDTYVDNKTKNFSNDISFTKRFGSKGAFLRGNFYFDDKTSLIDNYFNSEVVYYGDNPGTVERNQYRKTDDNSNTTYWSLTYRLPLIGKEFYLDFNYEYRNTIAKRRFSSFDYDAVAEEFETDINEDFSTDFKNTNLLNSPSAKLGYQDKKLNTYVMAKYLFRDLENIDYLRPNFNLKRSFEALTGTAYLSYRPTPQKMVYLYYNVNNSVPDISRFQAFSDITDPLNTVTGNPLLKPSTTHNFYTYYDIYNPNGNGLSLYMSSFAEDNAVVAKQTVNDDLSRETTYVNAKGVYRVNGDASLSRKIKLDSLRTLQINGGIGGGINRSINFNNDVQFANLAKTTSVNIGARFVWKDVMELRPYYTLSYTKNTFNFEGLEGRDFTNHRIRIFNLVNFTKKLEWQNDINFNYNPNVADGFQKSSWFWNSTLSYSVLKDQGTITLKAFDLLKQNTNAARVVNQNFVQDQQNTVLRQYFMIGFSWKFNSLGANAGQGGMAPPPPM